VAALERRLGARLERDVPLAPFTTFRIGGPADLLFRARTRADMVQVLRATHELELPVFLLGMGANILVGDRGVVASRSLCGWGIRHLGDGGARRWRRGRIPGPDRGHDCSGGAGGLHHYRHPSTVGSAIWQNLHFLSPPPARERTCFIAETVASCELVSRAGEVRDISREELRFGYDYSLLHETHDVVLSATFQLEPAPRDRLREVVRANLEWRDQRHPDLWLYPCAGSVFKKIEGIGAGRLIEQVGLKGHVLGDAQFFHKHANIIVNLGGATAADVRALMELAQTTVDRELGYRLEPEIGLVGEF
jgi:UDP-N-acetylmuramate dehydrogenase